MYSSVFFPGEIDFGSSEHEIRVSEGSSYRESTVIIQGNIFSCQYDSTMILFCARIKYSALINDAKMRPRLNTAHVKVKQSLTCNKFLYVTFLFNELLFFLYLQNIHTVFLLLDDDIREHRNVVL